MSDRIPSFFMLVPGPWQEAQDVVAALSGHGVAAEVRGETSAEGVTYLDVVADDDFASGFTWGRDGAFDEALGAQVSECKRALLIEVTQRLDECAPRVAALGRALRELGGIAVRMEASGSASAWEPWLERLESGEPAGAYAAGTIIVKDGDTFFTCGMHQFDRPEADISSVDPAAAVEWLDGFCIFLLDESPALAAGHTFRPNEQFSRRVLERWPDHRHHPDDGRHNPFGVWRFLRDGKKGLVPANPAPTVIPSLVALLMASEDAKGSALTEGEVEAIVNDAPSITMDLADVMSFERSRGYADIEPRLAWAQWQVVRSQME